MINKERAVDLFNALVIINNERIEDYEMAFENTDEDELKTLFSSFANTSQKCRHGLINEIERLRGKVEEGLKVSGNFFQTWADIQSSLKGKDRKAILAACEESEVMTIKSYRSAFNDRFFLLTPDQQNLIKYQHGLITTDKIKLTFMKYEF